MMKGLTLASLKKNYSLIPLFVILGGGMVMSAAYLARLAFKNPDVRVGRYALGSMRGFGWRRKSNPEPWQEYADKRYKLVQIKDIDYKKWREGRPEF